MATSTTSPIRCGGIALPQHCRHPSICVRSPRSLAAFHGRGSIRPEARSWASSPRADGSTRPQGPRVTPTHPRMTPIHRRMTPIHPRVTLVNREVSLENRGVPLVDQKSRTRTYERDGLYERRVNARSHRGRLFWSLNHRSSVTAIGAGPSAAATAMPMAIPRRLRGHGESHRAIT